MVLFAGEGVPAPSPSPCDISHGPVDGMIPAEREIRASIPGRPFPGIPLRSGGWDDAGGGRNPGRHPGQAFPGIPLRYGV